MMAMEIVIPGNIRHPCSRRRSPAFPCRAPVGSCVSRSTPRSWPLFLCLSRWPCGSPRKAPFCCTDIILSIDHLSMYHILLVDFIFLISSIYATGYFKNGSQSGRLTASFVKRYCMLWQAFQAMLLLVLMSNNIGVMWVALEATTLVSAFLILSDSDALSIEAMWKYLLVCSVGIVFAFMGTVFTVAAARRLRGGGLALSLQPVEHAPRDDRSRGSCSSPSSSSWWVTARRQGFHPCTPGFPTPTARPRRPSRRSSPASCSTAPYSASCAICRLPKPPWAETARPTRSFCSSGSCR